MNLKTSKRGSVLVVVSIMIALISAMIIILLYANNKNNLKSTEIQKKEKTEQAVKTIKNDKNLNTQNLNEKTDFSSTDKVLEIKYQYFADLVDIFGNKEAGGVIFKDNLKGNVKVTYLNNSYLMLASFENLPDLKDGNFYNGWLVKEGNPSDIINAGKAVKVRDVYMNAYTSEKDLTDYNFYILSIEDNDDGEEPSSYSVLSGQIKPVKKEQ